MLLFKGFIRRFQYGLVEPVLQNWIQFCFLGDPQLPTQLINGISIRFQVILASNL